MVRYTKVSALANFRKFFIRGLAILLPTVLTIWIFLAAYGFVTERVAEPINAGIRQLILAATAYPQADAAALDSYEKDLSAVERTGWDKLDEAQRRALVRHDLLRRIWRQSWLPLDLLGLSIAVILIYLVGATVGHYLGARLAARGESLIQRLPLIRKLYPSVKQVTDFFVGTDQKRLRFNRVVAVEYPRKGAWSVGLVTGSAPRAVQAVAGGECLAIFLPASPAPITGVVIIARRDETIDLPMTIEEALQFIMSGGVIVPAGQQMETDHEAPVAALPRVAAG